MTNKTIDQIPLMIFSTILRQKNNRRASDQVHHRFLPSFFQFYSTGCTRISGKEMQVKKNIIRGKHLLNRINFRKPSAAFSQ